MNYITLKTCFILLLLFFRLLQFEDAFGAQKHAQLANYVIPSNHIVTSKDSSRLNEQAKNIRIRKLNKIAPILVGIFTAIAISVIIPEKGTEGEYALTAYGRTYEYIMQFCMGFGVGYVATSVFLEHNVKKRENKKSNELSNIKSNDLFRNNISAQPFVRRNQLGFQTGIRFSYRF